MPLPLWSEVFVLCSAVFQQRVVPQNKQRVMEKINISIVSVEVWGDVIPFVDFHRSARYQYLVDAPLTKIRFLQSFEKAIMMLMGLNSQILSLLKDACQTRGGLQSVSRVACSCVIVWCVSTVPSVAGGLHWIFIWFKKSCFVAVVFICSGIWDVRLISCVRPLSSGDCVSMNWQPSGPGDLLFLYLELGFMEFFWWWRWIKAATISLQTLGRVSTFKILLTKY